jgi:two-component sensor histidine kinase
VIHTLDALEETHRKEIGYAYNLLGNISLNLKQYDEATGFYRTAEIFFDGDEYRFEPMNGKATASQKQGDYPMANAIYATILAQHPADQVLVATVIDNKAHTAWLRDTAYPALPEMYTALKIRADSSYSIGLNASYAHFSDYYASSNPDSALWYAHKMLDAARQNKSPDDILEAVDKLIRLNESSGLKQYWYGEFKKLNDSIQLSRDTTRNRFALIRYDVQKSKADNLQLHQNLTRQRIITYGVAGLALLIIAALLAWYRRRRKRIKLESENAIRNASLKTSKKVHDVVANGLYGIMNELEHVETIERETLMNRIEGLYEQSRNISYEEITPAATAGYNEHIHDLLNSFSDEYRKVIIIGNQPAFWSNILPTQKRELELVLNEIMINMKKHSQARNVVILFKQVHNMGMIQYKDDGAGFPAGFQFGNGLNNTVSRIKSLEGELNFGKSEKGGAAIAISFPLKPTNT